MAQTRPGKWAPHPESTRTRAVAMVRDGATYGEVERETAAGRSSIKKWIAAAGVAYAPRVNPHRECARRRWSDPAQRERQAEVGRRLFADPARKAALVDAARTPGAKRAAEGGRLAAWARRFPHLAALSSAQLAAYRRLARNRGIPPAEALRVVQAAAARIRERRAAKQGP